MPLSWLHAVVTAFLQVPTTILRYIPCGVLERLGEIRLVARNLSGLSLGLRVP